MLYVISHFAFDLQVHTVLNFIFMLQYYEKLSYFKFSLHLQVYCIG